MRILGLVAVLLACLPVVASAQHKPDDAVRAVVTVRSQFDGRLPAGKPGGKGRHIVLRQFSIPGGQRDVRLDLPDNGLLLVQLQAGGLATVIGGERRARLEGEWRTVSPPSAMRLETMDDTAVIDTIMISD